MTTSVSVQTIASAMADIERRIRQSVKDARQLRPHFKAIADDPGAGVTQLLASRYHGRLVAILSTVSADIIDLHHEMVEDAKARGIDMPPIDEPEDDGEIGIMGGGDR